MQLSIDNFVWFFFLQLKLFNYQFIFSPLIIWFCIECLAGQKISLNSPLKTWKKRLTEIDFVWVNKNFRVNLSWERLVFAFFKSIFRSQKLRRVGTLQILFHYWSKNFDIAILLNSTWIICYLICPLCYQLNLYRSHDYHCNIIKMIGVIKGRINW